MKIALLHYSYPPVVGGVETVVQQQAQIFAAHGHDVRVLCGSGEETDPRIELRLLPELASGSEAAPEQLVALLRPALADRNVVLIHNMLTMPFNLSATTALVALADELRSVRFVQWIHDLAACNPEYVSLPFNQSPYSLLAHAPSNVLSVAISHERRRQFVELTGETACQVIPNGVNAARVFGLEEPLRSWMESCHAFVRTPILLHPARLLKRKNIELSIALVAALREMGSDAMLVVTGAPDPHRSQDREYAMALDARVAGCGVEDAVLFPARDFPITDRDLAGLYSLADAVLYPSRQEGFGLPLMEAAVRRLPIYCSDIPVLKELALPNVRCFESDTSPALLARRILNDLAADPLHVAKRQALLDFSWDKIYHSFLSPLL